MRISEMHRQVRRALRWLGAGTVILGAGFGLGGCSGLLDVELPGQIPAEQINAPSLAPVLVRGVIGDLECAYSNYFAGASVHSDEWETSNSNVPLANWGERTIGADEDNYVVGSCADGGFGMHSVLHTARYQSEDVFRRLDAWTDQEVSGRTSFKATVRAYGGFAYIFLGETFCEVAIDKGPAQPPATALALAEQRFTEAITLAQQTGNTDILNLARVGLARASLGLKKYAQAAQAAGLVPVGYEKNADRGTESPRRWNDLYRNVHELGAYTAANAYRTLGDPRVVVVDAGRGAFVPTIRLWITTKFRSLNDPIRLASYREAQLILAESLAEQGQVEPAMNIINGRRIGLGLAPLAANDKDQAIGHIIEERRKELAYEGGHRLYDLLRKNIAWKVGANPFTGRPYGVTKCWPFPTKERSGA